MTPTPLELGRVRYARAEDATCIEALLNDSMSNTFRIHCPEDIYYLITNGVLSICQLDKNDIIIGFLSAMDYPRVPSVHPAGWEQYIWGKYKSIELKARNTLFIHLLTWNERYGRECIDHMLRTMFMHDPYLHYIAMVKSLPDYPWLIPGRFRAEGAFRRVPAADKTCNPDKLPALFIADRTTVCPRLRIRRAVEEDNDDIVPIIDHQAERLREIYGEFYISELISRHPESERALIVCEHKELAVGVMCLNTQINYEALEDSYVLAPFSGLRHWSCEEPRHSPTRDTNFSQNSLPSLAAESIRSRITCRKKDDELTRDYEFDSLSKITSSKLLRYSDSSKRPDMSQIDIYKLFKSEDEELEFDIVNIDKELLIVPHVLNYNNATGPSTTLTKIISISREEKDKLKKYKPPQSPSTNKEVKQPLDNVRRYPGEPNAFLIEIFAMHPDYDERYGFDMLEVAYEMFPNRDYCILCLPSNHPAFPLLEHFSLVVPNSRSSRQKFVTESLYVAHVNSVRGALRVRPGEKADFRHLLDVLEHTHHGSVVLDLYRSSLDSHALQSFVVLSENQPVGVVVLGPLEEDEAVRNQYDLDPESRAPSSDGIILAGVVSPVLSPHVRWIFRELIRQSIYCTLFWACRQFGRGQEHPGHHLMSLAGHMCPVHPHQAVPNLAGYNLDPKGKDLGEPFALWIIERPLTSLPRVFVNNSIVVVGASCTGLSFLETLIMGPTSQYVTFSNLTLVSENGLPTFGDCLKAAAICVPRSDRYTDRYLKRVPFYYYVDVISNIMTKIDRKRKCIHFICGDVKHYDILVLACGKQFQHPEHLKDSLELVKEVQKGKPCDRLLMDNPNYRPDRMPPHPKLPDNVMLINTLFEANICLRKLMRMMSERRTEESRLRKTNQVVVYGDCIEAYSCIAALLELGLTAELIVFVEPFPPVDDVTKMRVNCFNNETVDKRIQKSLYDIGVQVIRNGYLASWSVVDNTVQTLDIMTKLHYIKLNCFALFYYGLQAINLHAFRALNECGLVYDGGIVVNPTFETNDPNIFAAGTCVRYSRRLYAKKRSHAHYCSEDTGEALARLFLIKLDPFLMSDCKLDIPSDMLPSFSFSRSSSLGYTMSSLNGSISSAHVASILLTITSANRRWQPVIKFESPIIQSATLPGPFHYMKVRKPGKELPQAIHEILPKRGHTLTTDLNDNYFCVQLSALHTINSVVCLSHKSFWPEIMAQLYGKHEAYFNKMLLRYQRNEITDFFTYFTQPWMSLMYQETFTDLLTDINQQDVGTVNDLLKSRQTPYSVNSMQVSRSSLERAPSLPSSFSCESSVESLINIYGSLGGMWNVHTFRSLITNAIGSRIDVSECGQSDKVRNEAAYMFRRVDGERIVASHLTMHLNKYPVNNPQYAPTKLEYT